MNLVRNSLLGLGLIGLGWVIGSIFPAPSQFTAFARENTAPILDRLDVSPEGLAQLRESLSAQQFDALSQRAAVLAASTGDAIRIERLQPADLEDYVALAHEDAPGESADGSFETELRLCPGMRISNAPPADETNLVRHYANVVNVNGVSLAANPTRGACLSSGVGQRNGRMHKGIDYYSRVGGPVMAAADGVVVEKLYRDDYGNMLLIDHGNGVYTRYAHLSSFQAGLDIGSPVVSGQQIGLMGNTAAYSIPIHLHYEILLGDYANRLASFGLTPRSPFEFAAVRDERDAIVPLQLTRGEGAANQCPGGPITSAATITIRSGDRLGAIARACYGSEDAWRAIVSCNPYLARRNQGGVSPLATGHLLYVGDRMLLPAPGASCET